MCIPYISLSAVCIMVYWSWKLRMFPRRLTRAAKSWCGWVRLLIMTLYYNYFTTYMIVMETAAEPMFWFVDHFAKYFGPIFVTLVVVMTTSVVVIFYTCLLPHVYHQDLAWTCFHLVFGHWLLVNIVFHYIMAVFTNPGTPPAKNVPEVVSICKKCISPKPPRTHHCTICKRCILKMDHHCPWLNNCVGHYNHRYFYLFCVYMWCGTIYVSWVGYELFKQHFYGTMFTDNQTYLFIGYGHAFYHHAVLYEFILCSGVTFALGLLLFWHTRLIHGGQTSIEVHINQKEVSKFKKKNLVYKNPYNYGWNKNWQVFLGFTDTRSFIRHVLLPSSHLPEGDGLTWHRAHYKYDKDKGLQLL
ncbi:hypothetical protein ACJMK2_004909 [Sinanodonta woodiana]|uniref:Palmitoyltransferase n=1 Tax=Sinanodonta woodiana TaxID=1069815 RepID=A0ABD3VRW2_SINWO